MAKFSWGKAMGLAAGVAFVAGATAAFAAWDRLSGPLPPVSAAAMIAAERPAQPIRVTRVTFVAPDSARRFTGTVRPEHETAIAFRLPGKILNRKVEVGDRVVAGQVLAEMDDSDARLVLEAADAEVAASRIELERTKAAAKRSLKLFASGTIAKAALEIAVSAEAQAQGRADRAQRSRDQAANALSYAALVADASGVVTAVAADAGQVVAAGQPVVTLAPTSRPDVVFALPEQMRSTIEDAAASAELWEGAGRVYELKLRDISPDVDPSSRTYRVRMSFINPDAQVSLGRTVTVTLRAAAGEPVAALPLGAILDDGTGTFVWRLQKGGTAVQRVPVVLSGLDDTSAKVRGELAEGDAVVGLGAHKLDPARPVRVVETTSAPLM